MASSFSTDLKLELMVTGENAGTWGTKTNTNLNLLQQAIAGFQSISIAGGAQTTALTMDNAAISNARNAVIKLTGTITGNQVVTVPNGIEKTYIVQNGTTGAFTVEFKTASGTGVTFATTNKGFKIVYSDGTNIVDVELSSVNPIIEKILDTNGNEEIIFTATASAVNELTIANAATGNAPEIAATGSDTNIDLKLTPKGTGKLNLDGIKFPNTDGSANQILSTDGAGALSFINPPTDFGNIVINGDMQIAQRSTSVASITTAGYYTLDRMYLGISSLGTWTMSQSTDVPTGQGFANSLKLDCTTADASPAASDYLQLTQIFEGQNLQYLKKGTANAVSLTASFWVKSTKTGTFIVQLFDNNNTRSISASYTVSVTNTWEFKTVTFAGDTTGAFTNNDGGSLYLNFWLGAGTNFTSGSLATTWGAAVNANTAVGQVNIADNTSNDWLITGIQLEAGTSATGFEFLPIDVNLNRCFRYFQLYTYTNDGLNFVVQEGRYADSSGNWTETWSFPNGDMRAVPTLTYTDSVGNSGKMTVRRADGTETNDISLRPFSGRLKNNRVDFNTYNQATGFASQGSVGFAFARLFKLDAEL